MDSKSTIRKRLENFGEQATVVVIYSMALGFTITGVRFVLDEASELHWILGIITAIVLLFLLFALLWWFWAKALASPESSREWFGRHPALGVAMSILYITIAAMAAMTTISFNLFGAEIIEYTSDREITFGRLLDYYGWHFVDSVPILQIWSAFDVSPPATGEGFWPGFLVLVFRVLIIGPGIALISTSRNIQKARSADSQDVD